MKVVYDKINAVSFTVAESKKADNVYLKRRMIYTKSRYFDVIIKPVFDGNKYNFDLNELVKNSFQGATYILEINDCGNIDTIILPIGGIVRFGDFYVSLNFVNNVLKYQIAPNVHASLKNVLSENGKTFVEIVTDFKKDKMNALIMRRSTLSRSGQYDKIIKKQIEVGDVDTLVLDDLLLDGYAERGHEIWDVAVECDGGYVFVDVTEVNIPYSNAKNDIAYKLFNSEGKLSIWTKDGECNGKNRVKVAILGSCYIKEAFHSLNFTNPDYKRYYDNVLVGFHHSLISLTSKPFKGCYQIQSKNLREVELYSEHEFIKNFFDKLKSSKAEYLLIDNYADATLSVGKCKDDIYITRNYYLNNSNLFTDFIKLEREYSQHEEERIDLYKSAVCKLREIVEKIIPLKNIILVKGRQSLYKEVGGEKELWQDYEFYEKSNAQWDKLDDIFLQTIPEARMIDMRDAKYISVESELNITPNHFQSEYYRTLLNSFNKIVLFDLLGKQGKE